MDTEPIHVYKYTAVMVEPREHKAYKYVLNNFLENLYIYSKIIYYEKSYKINGIRTN